MRLFVALELPQDAVGALLGWASRTLRGDGLRLLPAESLHVTLAFLGARPAAEAEAIGAAVAACAAPVPDLRLGEPVWLGRGSALAVDVVDGAGACARLQGAVSEALAALGVYAHDGRAFRPHVTVARVRRGARISRELPAGPDGPPFDGAALTLYESVLSPRGASYRPLVRAELSR